MPRNPEDNGPGHAHNSSSGSNSLQWQTAKHALRCLIGCNIGEGIGAAIGFVLGWDMISTLVLAVGLAFAIIPMLKTMPIRQAARVTVVGDTASIAAVFVRQLLKSSSIQYPSSLLAKIDQVGFESTTSASFL
jgi:hypothetical protein